MYEPKRTGTRNKGFCLLMLTREHPIQKKVLDIQVDRMNLASAFVTGHPGTDT